MAEAFTGAVDGGFDATTRHTLETVGLSFEHGTYGVEPTTWAQLSDRRQEGVRPEDQRQLAALCVATAAVRESMQPRDHEWRVAIQTVLASRGLYQEAVALDSAALRTELGRDRSAITVQARLLPAVTHARLLLTTEGVTTPLLTWQAGWQSEAAEFGNYVDMSQAPQIAHATGNPK